MKKEYIILSVLVGVLVFSFVLPGKPTTLGSVEATAGAYMATTTNSAFANTAYKAMTGPGVLGSVVITDDPAAGTITLRDATSTATSTCQGELAPGTAGTYCRTIAVFEATAPEGTYVFDSEIKYGLVVETQAGYTGAATITYKR